MNEYKKYRRLALKHGWKVPTNSVFPDESWVTYWKGMEAYYVNPDNGRPIIPHRTGR